jgi:hypothetical protein
MPKLDMRHIETIARILEAIATVESDTARAVIACEDAYVALSFGLSLGLTPKHIAAQHDKLMAEQVTVNEMTVVPSKH